MSTEEASVESIPIETPELSLEVSSDEDLAPEDEQSLEADLEGEARTEDEPEDEEGSEDKKVSAQPDTPITSSALIESVPLRAALLEALLVASSEPLAARKLAEVIELETSQVKEGLEFLQTRTAEEDRGYFVVEVAGKWQIRTKPLFSAAVRRLKAAKPKRLSPAALETLAVVAYRQPIVRSDIEQIRGVDSAPTLKTLLDRGLIKIAGHQSTVGQPALYGTTEEFLKVFGLNKLPDLPSLRELKELAREPGELEIDEQSGASA